MKHTLPEFVERNIQKFLEEGKAGSITLHSDGTAIRQTETKVLDRGEPIKK